jgi:hypothetical protein
METQKDGTLFFQQSTRAMSKVLPEPLQREFVLENARSSELYENALEMLSRQLPGDSDESRHGKEQEPESSTPQSNVRAEKEHKLSMVRRHAEPRPTRT